jgi:hypothetical protein
MSDKSVTVQPQQTTLADLQRMATSIAKSGLFGVSDPDTALAMMLEAQAEGRHPAAFMRDNCIIAYEGKDGTVRRRAKYSEAMQRDFIANGGKITWHQLDDQVAEATFSHPAGGTVKIRWDIARAKQAGIYDRPRSLWPKYPRRMLSARCISEGCRTVGPFATNGTYTPEELRDMEHEIDITPPQTKGAVDAATTQAVRDVSTALTPEEIDAHINAMDVRTLPELKTAFGAAWTHAKQANDKAAQTRFKQVYDLAVEGLARNDMEHTI